MKDISTKRPFAENIKALRVKQGLTSQQMADRLHVKLATLRAWIDDVAQPCYETLVHICQAFHIEDLEAFISDPEYIRKGGSKKISYRQILTEVQQLGHKVELLAAGEKDG